RVDDGGTIHQDNVSKAKGKDPARNLIAASAWYQAGRVNMQLCIDRRPPETAFAGTYEGTVSIVDSRIHRVDLPVRVTAAAPQWQAVLLLLVLAVIGGSWYVWVLHYVTSGGTETASG